jgi:diguanylate cyclase (GGDEF)-like protein
MPDSDTPQPGPERDGGAPEDASAAEPVAVNGSPEQGAQSPAAPGGEPQGVNGGVAPTTTAAPGVDRPGRVRQLVQGRTGVWAAVAVLCVVAGILASVLGARAVARNDSAAGRRAFQQTSTSISSTLKLAIRHEEQLVVSASTFFAAHPKASHAEFAVWVTWARTRRRYPELDALGLLTPAQSSPALLLSRDTGLSVYSPVSAGSGTALAVETPVYRGNVTPRSVFGRRAASVGWLREVLVPGVVLQQALTGQTGYALLLRHHAGSADVVFASGAPRSNAQSATTSLYGGWSVTTLGPALASGVFANESSLALLIAGILLSVLVGLLVFVLGSGRTPAPVRAQEARELPELPESPDADLYDPLTGLPNRSLTLDRAERMVARAGRDSGMLAGALFVDIDRLKDVNEKLGQAAGDQLLRIVGQRLEGVVRAGDTVGRLAGDEFVVLVESAARGVRLDSLAQRMIEALHKPVELDDFGPSFVLTASIGVAFGRYATPGDLLRDANVALASAKAAGKDRYTLFNANMRTVIEGRAVLEAELSTALAEQQFFQLYQPIYDLSTRKVVGLEALIRWQHPAQGVLVPADFIPLAEETGLIVPIGRWALEQACNRAAAWHVAGNLVGMSVKVSPYQLNRDGFATDVRRALQQSGIEPSLLTLEIAEATVMRDIPAATLRLREIKQLGVSIAIDDFGSGGYAHHADLRQMPLDSLRVDRGSLAASEDEAYRSWLLQAILVVGRDLDLTVIATGIETHEQMTTLQTLGCTLAQGDLMGKPTPVDAVESLFHSDLPVAPAPSVSPAQPTVVVSGQSDPQPRS